MLTIINITYMLTIVNMQIAWTIVNTSALQLIRQKFGFRRRFLRLEPATTTWSVASRVSSLNSGVGRAIGHEHGG
jgi:hypothetical protein